MDLPAMIEIERQIRVSFRHRVLFVDDVFEPKNAVLRELLVDGQPDLSRKVLVVAEKALTRSRPNLPRTIQEYFRAQPDCLTLVCAPVLVEGGERAKESLEAVTQIHALISRHHVDRGSYVIAVGGGAVLDMVGLAAATAHRGCRHVRVPTTTLSQADSGVGIKNGINAFDTKNFLGTFAPPFAVLNDFQWLQSLSERERRAGFAEAVKVALIRDVAFFETLERECARLREFEPASVRRVIHHTAELHVNHIATAGDPFEFGAARPLDFGHWSAHKLEQLSEYRISHGEAVAIGIALDTLYSARQGWLAAEVPRRVMDLLTGLGFSLFADELAQRDAAGDYAILGGLEEFREHLGGRLTVTMLRGLGKGFEVHELSVPDILQCIRELQQHAAAG